ncbi:MAG TPA: YIP1 family protein [Cytophagales bacterium]|nr:YIP1 family protein [Cytophagales bacterium]
MPFILAFWLSPYKTINNVLKGDLDFNYNLPLLLNSLTLGISAQYWVNGDIFLKTSVVMFITLLVFLVWAIFYPRVIKFTGKLWKGEGSIKGVTKVVSLASLPYLFFLIVEGINLIKKDPITVPPFIGFMLPIISYIIMVKGISKVQNFERMIAILNIIIPPIILIILCFLIGI